MLTYSLLLFFSASSLTTLFICSGYLAPEYALLGQLTKKADVYSFGVLMLEIISGRSSSKSAFGEELMVLVEWVYLSKLLLLVILNHATILFYKLHQPPLRFIEMTCPP